MNQCLAGLPGRSFVEAEHERRPALQLAIHRARHRILSRAVALDGLDMIGQLDLGILIWPIGRRHTLAVQRCSDGYKPQAQHHKHWTLYSVEHWSLLTSTGQWF